MFHGKNNIPNPMDTSKIPRICADLEKNGGQNCSTGQRFIFTEVNFYKIHILVLSFAQNKKEGICTVALYSGWYDTDCLCQALLFACYIAL